MSHSSIILIKEVWGLEWGPGAEGAWGKGLGCWIWEGVWVNEGIVTWIGVQGFRL